jgi:hypothetical protein
MSECVLNETVGSVNEFVELHIVNQFFLKESDTDMGKAPVDSFKNSFRITQWPWGGQGNETVTDKLKLEFFISASTKDKPKGIAYLGPRRPANSGTGNNNGTIGTGNNSTTNSSGDTSGSGSVGSSSGFGNDTTSSGSSSLPASSSGSAGANDTTGSQPPPTGAAGIASSSGPATTNDTTSASASASASGSLPASGSGSANDTTSGSASSSQDISGSGSTDGGNSTETSNSTNTQTQYIKNKGEVNFDNFGQMLFYQKVELKSYFDELGPKLTEIEGPELRESEDGTGYIVTIYFPYFKYSAFYDPMVNGKPVLSESPSGAKSWWDGLSYAARIGFIIGICIAFILLVMAISCCCCRNRGSQDAAPANQAQAEGGATHYHAAPRSSQSQ